MDHKLAIIDLRAGGAGADTAMKPLMLQPMLFCPVVRWVCQELLACGIERFFVVCEENWRNEAAEALHDISGVSFYDRLEEAFSAAEGGVIVVPGAVVPVWGEGNRAVYTADAALLCPVMAAFPPPGRLIWYADTSTPLAATLAAVAVPAHASAIAPASTSAGRNLPVFDIRYGSLCTT